MARHGTLIAQILLVPVLAGFFAVSRPVRAEDSAVDLQRQLKEIEKEIADLEKIILNSQKQLSNEGFLAKAPQKITDGMRAKQAEYEAQVAKIGRAHV